MVASTISLLHVVAILLIICLLTVLLALLYRCYRIRVEKDGLLLDSFFCCGSNSNYPLICCSLIGRFVMASSVTWSAVLFLEFGIVGQALYAAGMASPIFLISIIVTKFRIHFNDSKTFLQMIKTKFGTECHFLLTIASIFINIFISILITSDATTLLTTICTDFNRELMCLILVIICGLFLFIGGQGGYFWTAYIFSILALLITTVFAFDFLYKPLLDADTSQGHMSKPDMNRDEMIRFDVTSASSVNRMPDRILSSFTNDENAIINDNITNYHFLSNLTEYQWNANVEFEMVDLVSKIAFLFLGSCGSSVMDQSVWTVASAANPKHVVAGFTTAGCIVFFVIFSYSVVFGNLLKAASFAASTTGIITNDNFELGTITELIISELNPIGKYFFFTLYLGFSILNLSSQILSLSSISIYEIYQAYVKQKLSQTKTASNLPSNLLIEQPAGKMESVVKKEVDIMASYLELEAKDFRVARGTVLIVSVLVLVVSLIIMATGIHILWIIFFSVILMTPFILPIMLSVCWCGCRGGAIIISCVVGCAASILICIVYAICIGGVTMDLISNSRLQGIVTIFSLTGLILAGLFCTLISFHCKKIEQKRDARALISSNEADNYGAPQLSHRIDHKRVMAQLKQISNPLQYLYKTSQITAIIFGIGFPIIFCILFPGLTLLLSYNWTKITYQYWTTSSAICVAACGLFVVLSPGFMLCAAFCSKPKNEIRRRWKNRGKKEDIFLITDGVLKEKGGGSDLPYTRVYPNLSSMMNASEY